MYRSLGETVSGNYKCIWRGRLEGVMWREDWEDSWWRDWV